MIKATLLLHPRTPAFPSSSSSSDSLSPRGPASDLKSQLAAFKAKQEQESQGELRAIYERILFLEKVRETLALELKSVHRQCRRLIVALTAKGEKPAAERSNWT